MATPGGFDAPRTSPVLMIGAGALGLLLLIGLAWFIYVQMTGTLTSKVKEDQPVLMNPETLPPPPPPPPPPPKPEEKPPEPTEAPTPTPEPAAAPKPDAPAPMSIAADAQAGADAFGLRAGSGGGMGGSGSTGTCMTPPCGGGGGGAGRISDGLYRGQLRRAIQSAVSRDSRVNKFVFTNSFSIVVTPAGRITAVQMRSGSGKARVDDTLTEILQGLTVPAPPVKSQYPVVIEVRGRNQLGG